MSAFSGFCVPEIEGCGPIRGTRGGNKQQLPLIRSVECLDLCCSKQDIHPSGVYGDPPPCLQHIVRSPSLISTDVCCIDADSNIYLIDTNPLRCTYTLNNAHNAPITSASFLHQNCNVLVTSSQDGAVKFWDLRAPHRSSSSSSSSKAVNKEATQAAAADAAVQITPPGSREADVWGLAVRNDDLVFAVSYKSSIKGFDLRVVCSSSSTSTSPSAAAPAAAANEQQGRKQMKQKRSKKLLWDIQVHGDTVTALQFHPVYPQLLFSGGEDSLVCLSDTSAAAAAAAVGSRRCTDSRCSGWCSSRSISH